MKKKKQLSFSLVGNNNSLLLVVLLTRLQLCIAALLGCGERFRRALNDYGRETKRFSFCRHRIGVSRPCKTELSNRFSFLTNAYADRSVNAKYYYHTHQPFSYCHTTPFFYWCFKSHLQAVWMWNILFYYCKIVWLPVTSVAYHLHQVQMFVPKKSELKNVILFCLEGKERVFPCCL